MPPQKYLYIGWIRQILNLLTKNHLFFFVSINKKVDWKQPIFLYIFLDNPNHTNQQHVVNLANANINWESSPNSQSQFLILPKWFQTTSLFLINFSSTGYIMNFHYTMN